MKTFLKYVLATVVGILVSTFILIIVLGIFITSAIKEASSPSQPTVVSNSVLYVSLDHGITEKTENNPFNDLNIPGYGNYKSLGLDDIIERIQAAKEDKNIKGIYLNPVSVGTGFASMHAIRDALEDFKTSGKFIYAYSDVYSQKAYYLASVADSVYINPEGMLDFRGLATSIMFFKDALDKLGVDVQVVKVGTFKSAVEPFILNQMSDANREQVNSYLQSIYHTFLSDIGISRNISVDSLHNVADRMAVRNAETAQQYGFVDGAIYKDEMIAKLKSRLGVDSKKDVPTVSLLSYKQKPSASSSKDRVAVLYAYGNIVDGEGMESNIGGDRISRELRKLREDDRVKAIVLRVNSGGGSALASDIIWREVELTKQQKPIMVSMGDYAASGGYYISAAADSIFAEAGTLTGSIGVFGMIPNFKGLIEGKMGIHFDEVKTGKFAAMGADLTKPLTAEETAIIQMQVDRVYDTFLKRVADGRGLTVQEVDSIGQGRVWTGEQAVQIGLVDAVGDLNRAIRAAAAKADLEDYRLVKYPVAKDPWEAILKTGKKRIQSMFVNEQMGEYAKYLETIKSVTENSGVLAKVPFSLEIY